MKKNLIFVYIFITYISCSLFSPTLYAKENGDERILSYHTEIEMKPDLSMIVTETIEVRCKRILINRGIFRDFPKEYTDIGGNQHTFDFNIIAIFRGDVPEDYHIQDLGKGTRVYIGKKAYRLPPGNYTYTLIYEVNNPTLVLEDSYAFHWDVTGIRWPFPIDKASAVIKLPYGNFERVLSKEAYVGEEPASEKDVLISIDIPGNPTFTMKRPLHLQERFTVFVSWLKKPPPQQQKIIRKKRA